MLHDSLADRDGPSKAEKGMGAEAFRAYPEAAVRAGRLREHLRRAPAAGHGHRRRGGPPPKLAERYVVTIAQGRNADYLKYMQAFLGAARKSGHRRTTGQIVFGPNAGAFASLTYYDSWDDIAKGRPPQRAMSPSELAAFNSSAQGLSSAS